jgi:hypothetical protein
MRIYKIDNLSEYCADYKKYKNLYTGDLQVIKIYDNEYGISISYHEHLSKRFAEKYRVSIS